MKMLFPILTLLCFAPLTAKTLVDASTVDKLDINRYMGLWYEIVRFDTWFENNVNYVTASYNMTPKGNIEVVNRSYKNGKLRKSKGRVKRSSAQTPGKLRVSFFLMFYGDYNILELDHDNYEYAMIGSDDGKFFWILSRTPKLDPEHLHNLLRNARRRGYDLSKLVFCGQGDAETD